MKKSKITILSTIMLLAIAGCGQKPTTEPTAEPTAEPTVEPTVEAPTNALTREQADALVATFEEAVNGTVKATYEADYALDVVTESASAKAFARTIKDVTTIEADFTAGNYYFHAKRVGRNLLTETEDKVVEALVWKDGDTYKYLEQNMGDVATLTDETSAVAKIAELMKKVSNREGGFLTPETLVYSSINDYEHSEFLLDSRTVTVEEWFDDPVSMLKTDDNGIEVKSELPYVAYQTDGGVSELGGTPAANTTVVTNAKGYVTNYEITYNDAQLAMPIMTPAPVLHLTGSRTLQASYGETIEKLDTIEHHSTTGTIALPSDSTKGYAEVFTCAPNDFANMQEVSATKEYKVGDWLCIKVTPADGNTVLNVAYGGSSETLVPPAQAGGYYCFLIKEGQNSISINYEGSASLPTTATVTVTADEHATVTGITTFTLTNGQPGNWGAATEEGAVTVGASEWAAIQVQVAEGYEVDTVKVNGKDAFFLAGYYCVNTKLPKVYNFTVTTKEVSTTPSGDVAIIDIIENASCESIVVKSFDVSAPTNQTEVADGAEVPFGETKWIAVVVTPKEGKEVESITVNGVATQTFGGMQCAKIAAAGTYEVVVKIVGEDAVVVDAAVIDVVENENCESIVVKSFDVSAPTNQTEVADGAEVPYGGTKWIAVVVTPKEGYVVESITVNGVATQTFGGMQCAKIAEVGTYTIVVTVVAA